MHKKFNCLNQKGFTLIEIISVMIIMGVVASVSIQKFDIVSNSSWSSFDELKKSKLATCITKGHLFSQTKGVTRIFGDYSFADNGVDIESVGNTTIIPNNVIKDIKKI